MPNNPSTDTTSADPPPDKRSLFTNRIALAVIVFSGLLLILLIIISWYNLKPDDHKDGEPIQYLNYTHAKELLNLLLPVIGTWMGTILAFYFSKENFAAANQQVKDILEQVATTDQKLKDLKATDVMIKTDSAILLKIPDQAKFEDTKLSELLDQLNKTQSERMPILKDPELTYLFLIYRTTLERFILQFEAGTVKPENPPADKKDLTVAHLLHSNFDLIKGILAINLDKCFLPINATLGDARRAMQDNSLCQDVFITQTGKKTEKVEGWITNTMIIEKAELFTKAGNS